MKIDDCIIKPYRCGWQLTEVYTGKSRKTGKPKSQKKQGYFPTLKQTLLFILDHRAGECTTTQELFSLLGSAEVAVEAVLRRNGLVQSQAAFSSEPAPREAA